LTSEFVCQQQLEDGQALLLNLKQDEENIEAVWYWIAKSLGKQGCPKLQNYLNTHRLSEKYDATYAAALLGEGLTRCKLFVLLDNMHLAIDNDEDVSQWKALFKGVIQHLDMSQSESRILLLSQQQLSNWVYEKLEVPRQEYVPLHVGGLSKNISLHLAINRGTSNSVAHKIYDFTKGHPMAINLLLNQSEPFLESFEFTERSLSELIDSIFKDITSNQKNILNVLGLMQYANNLINLKDVPFVINVDDLAELGQRRLIELYSGNSFRVHDFVQRVVQQVFEENNPEDALKNYRKIWLHFIDFDKELFVTWHYLRKYVEMLRITQSIMPEDDVQQATYSLQQALGRINGIHAAGLQAFTQTVETMWDYIEERNKYDLALQLGWVYERIDKVQQSVHWYQQAEFAIVAPYSIKKLEPLANQAWNLHHLKRDNEVKNKLQQARTVIGNITDEDDFIIEVLMVDVIQARIWVEKESFHDAESLLLTAFSHLKLDAKNIFEHDIPQSYMDSPDVVRLLAQAYHTLGLSVERKSRSYAIKAYQRAETLYKLSGDPWLSGVMRVNIGNMYGWDGKNNKSLEAYQEALQLADELQDDAIIRPLLYNRAFTYSTLGKWDIAIDELQESARVLKRTGRYYHRLPNVLYELSVLLVQTGRWDEANGSIEQVATVCGELNNKIIAAWGEFVKAEMLIYQVDAGMRTIPVIAHSVEEAIKELYAISEKDPYAAIQAGTLRARLALEIPRLQDAQRALLDAEEVHTALDDRDSIQMGEWYRVQAMVFAKMQNIEDANKYFNLSLNEQPSRFHKLYTRYHYARFLLYDWKQIKDGKLEAKDVYTEAQRLGCVWITELCQEVVTDVNA